MKNFKNSFLILVLLFSISNAQAQKSKFSIALDFGYGFNLDSHSFFEGKTEYITENISNKISAIHSYGKGLNFGMSFDYSIHENIEVGILLSYLKGAKLYIPYAYIDQDPFRLATTYGQTLRIIPEIKINQPIFNQSVVFKVGFIIGINPNFTIDDEKIYRNSFSQQVRNGGLSYGIMSGIGYEINISNELSIVPEIRGFYQSYSPDKGEVTVVMSNGEDHLETLAYNERYAIYVDEYDPKAAINSQRPRIELRFFRPFSSIGFNLSLVYRL